MRRQGGGDVEAPIARFSDDELQITVPTSAATGPFTVTIAGAGASSAASFEVTQPDIILTAEPPEGTLISGQATSYVLSLAGENGFSQLATLNVEGLPLGVTPSFKPSHMAAGQQAILSLAAPPDQRPGQATFRVTASAMVQGVSRSSAVDLSLTIEPISTTFIGRVAHDDAAQTPLEGVAVRFLGRDDNGAVNGCAAIAISDAAGNFIFTNLPAACTGRQLVRYDGSTALVGRYAGVDKLNDIVGGQVTFPMSVVHLPRLDDADVCEIRQNWPDVQQCTFPRIANLAVTVYAGTTLALEDDGSGKDLRPDPFPLQAKKVFVDRLPGGMVPDPSGKIVPFLVAFQPANSTASQPVPVYFPNPLALPANAAVELITLDPTKGTMVGYGTGKVSSNGRQIVPDADPQRAGRLYGLVHMGWHGPVTQPPNDINPGPPRNDVCPIGAKPVDPASGLDVVSETDLAFGGARGGVSIQRTYRTGSTAAGPFGIGSGHNYGYRLDTNTPQSSQVVRLIMPDGNRLPFIRGASGPLRNETIPALRGAELTVAGSGEGGLRFKDGTVFHFVPSNVQLGSVLTSITDANGNRTTLKRNPSRPAQITEIVDAVGRRLQLQYDGADRIKVITDPIGRAVLYEYNAAGALAKVTDPAGNDTTYDYEAPTRIKSVTAAIDGKPVKVAENVYASGRVIEQKLPGGGSWKFEYATLNPNAPASPVQQTVVTDPRGNRTTYRFNPEGFLVDVTDPLGQTRVYEREDGTNLLRAIRGTANCNACSESGPGDRSFTWDSRGNLLSVTDALDHTTHFTHEPAFGKVASIRNALDEVTTFAYGAGGNLLSVTDANQHTTSFAYDLFGQLRFIRDALAHETHIDYDGFGNAVAIRDPLGNVTRMRYDGVSRLVETVDALGRSTQTDYDPLDRLTKVVDALGHSVKAEYDAAGNLTKVIDARNNATSFAYDPKTRENTRTDSLGKTDYRRYDVAGNLIQFVDRRGRSSNYAYDELNRLVREVYFDAGVERTYDQFGKLANVTDTQGGAFSFTYDAVGRQLSAAGPYGTIEYARDALGRVTQRQVVGQSAASYEYDSVGNLSLAAMPEVSLRMTYDPRNQLATEERSNGVKSSYTYRADSQVLSILHQQGDHLIERQEYTYDGVGNRTSRRSIIAQPVQTDVSQRHPDARSDRLLDRADTHYSYDENGNRIAAIGPTGTLRLTWDGRNRLQEVGPETETLRLLYDFEGNLLSINSGSGPMRTKEVYLLDDLTNVALLRRASGEPVSILTGRSVDQHLAVANFGVFFLRDALNSVVATVDREALSLEQLFYEPYGATLPREHNSPFAFIGRQPVAPDLYYLRARFLDTASSAFLNEDRAGFDASNANLFSYARNNPTTLADPFGLRAQFTDPGIIMKSGDPDPGVIDIGDDRGASLDCPNRDQVIEQQLCHTELQACITRATLARPLKIAKLTAKCMAEVREKHPSCK